VKWTRCGGSANPRAMGQQNGTAQALFLQGIGCRPEAYRLRYPEALQLNSWLI
jgi:hypothetical protein